MICSFFGHKRIYNEMIKEKIRAEAIRLINCGCNTFYVGNNGIFDLYVQQVMSKLSEEYGISFSIIISSVNEKALSSSAQVFTVFPEGFEAFLPRFAIPKRNEWMMRHSDYIVCYMEKRISRLDGLIEKARRRGIPMTNLAEESPHVV